jgi:hypothetical protein
MSGGYVKKDGLGPREHQTVIFTFKGPTDGGDSKAWNTAIRALKRSFLDHNPGCVIGVTLDGPDTPPARDFVGGPAALRKVLKDFGD